MTVEERFWQKVDKGDGTGCWLWLAAKQSKGYGEFWPIRNEMVYAHRMAWTLTNGAIPDGLCVLHHCDIRACCNPDHLFLGTPADNTHDMVVKGRARGGSLPGEQSPHAKLTTNQVLEIRRLYANRGMTQIELGRLFGVSHTTISHIVCRKHWAHVPDDSIRTFGAGWSCSHGIGR